MTSLALRSHALPGAMAKLRAASPLLWYTSMAFLVGFCICAVLAAIDPRLFNGISVWIKPAKFFLSLAVHMLTLSFGLWLLPQDIQRGRGAAIAATTMATMAIGEMVYITFRAARAEASHFNDGSALAGMLYTAMGIGAALMMVVTAWIGYRILRHGNPGTVHRATGTSFVVAAILTLIIGFTLGGMGSHWIGGDQTDATGLPIFGWSTTGGDLRSSHFLALHLMQIVPFVAWAGGKKAAIAAMAAGVALSGLTFMLALNGIPIYAN